jgi:hypothetical protein
MIKIKDEVLRHILKDIKQKAFTMSDGCACGEYAYQLDKDLWLFAYRSCRKSSNTPNDKMWHIHDLKIYKNIKAHYYLVDGKEYIDYYEAEGEPIDFKLNPKQEKQIIKRLKRVSWLQLNQPEYREQDGYFDKNFNKGDD